MAFKQGTATDYIDLYKKIIDFATANGWTLIECNGNTISPTSADVTLTPINDTVQNDLYLQSTGHSGNTNIQIRMFTVQNDTAGRYNFGFSTGIYNTAGDTQLLPQLYSNLAFSTLWGGTTNYWLSVSLGRIMCTWRIGSAYYHFYVGYFYPFVLPNQYLAPLICIGQSNSSTASYVSDLKSYSSGFQTVISNTHSRVNNNTLRLYPFRNIFDGVAYNGGLNLGNVYNTTNEFMLRDCQVIYDSFIAGKLDGVFAVSSINNTAENVITNSAGEEFVCFGQHNSILNSQMYAIPLENI